MDERQAIARLKGGDIEGLALLVEKYQLQALRTAMLITRECAQAEDVVQSAFIRAYERIDQFDDRRPFGPWFLKSVVNAAIQAARRRQRTLSLDDQVDGDSSFLEFLEAESPGSDDRMEANERKQVVRQALQKLSPEQRAAVVMRYFLEMSEKEIAEVLDAPPGTIKWRLYAGRNRLRGILQRFTSSPTEKEGSHE